MKRAKSDRPQDCPFVGKGGLKLRFALEHFGISITGKTAVDLGCAIGGFTDCLLHNGASKVYSVDTAYGVLAYRLRVDERVVVCERSNVLHWRPPEFVDIVTIDVGWTKQKKCLPAAAEMLAPDGQILSLVKPQYECDKSLLNHGVLPAEHIERVVAHVRSSVSDSLLIADEVASPYKGRGGNREIWLRLVRA